MASFLNWFTQLGRKTPLDIGNKSINKMENPSFALSPSNILSAISSTGYTKPVNTNNALAHSVVFACVRLLAETVGSINCHLFRRTNGGKERATDHPSYPVVVNRPNEWMGMALFREQQLASALLQGNSYCYIERDGGGVPINLLPLDATKVRVGRIDGNKVYEYRLPDGQVDILTDDEVFHLTGFSLDGLVGCSVIEYGRTAIGLAMSAEEYGSRFYSSGANPGGVIESPQRLTDEAALRLRESWENVHSGLGNSHKTAILEEGMTFKPISMSNEDSQFLQTRQFQISEIARLFKVPPHMVGDLSRATFSNIEHQSIEFVTYSIRPWLIKLEQEANRKLIPLQEQADYFVEFQLESLLRGDTPSRYSAYSIALNNGWMSRNEVRERENLNRVDGLDTYLAPLNMGSTQPQTDPAATQPEAQQPDNQPPQDQTGDNANA